MNSYHQAILQATSNGIFPELCDAWRTFHKFSPWIDNDLQIKKIDIDFCGSKSTRNEEIFEPLKSQKILYVPVTRKVSSEIRKN